MSFNTSKRFLATGAVATAAALTGPVLTGCDVEQIVTGKEPAPKVQDVVYIPTDISRSTLTERRRGGLYEHAIERVLLETARQRGSVVLGRITGNSLGATWAFGKTFKTPGGIADPTVARAARERQARSLMPRVRSLLKEQGDGTDVLGALRQVARRAATLPAGKYNKVAVVVTDGAIVVGRNLDLYHRIPRTPASRRHFIAGLKRAGEVPDLTGFKVYLVGVAVGVRNRNTAGALITLWDNLISASGAHLVANDADLVYP